METALVLFTQARQALEKARTIDEVKTVRDAAERLRLYLKQEKESLQMQNHAAAIRLRAERRAGEMLREGKENGDRQKPGQYQKSHDAIFGLPPTLSEIGITASQSSRWQAIASIPEEKFELFVEEKIEAEEELTQALALRYARSEANLIERAEIAARPVQIPQGKYSCVVIDPPWPMEKIERDARPWQAGFDYPTMKEEELQAFPVPSFAADDCHLYLWTTHKFLPMALRLAEHWGFRYQCLMTWVKNVGMTPYSWMYSTEHVLFCRRGSLQLEKFGMRLDFAAKIREHSRKPDEFYDLVRQASPGPRIDVFSREERDGFDQWGKESGKFAEVAA
jgi:N6-adenosine-specific RNA methylase IME4